MIRPDLAATAGQWAYISCHCIVNYGNRGVSFTYGCSACGNTNLRFIHTLEHDNGQQITVGIECARALLPADEWEIPGLAENEVKRKERWRVRYKRPGRCVATFDDLVERGKV